MGNKQPPPILLASTSIYRKRLLERLGLAFECVAPGVAELASDHEDGEALARRLSAEKALAVSTSRVEALVIGSDQVAVLHDQLLGKPGNEAAAREQLRASSGCEVLFQTAVSLARGDQILDQRCVLTTVRFRQLEPDEIANYVSREKPYDCAGSFRWEALGITLFESLCSEDPTALEGLPLIATTDMLRKSGINPLITAK